MLSAFEEDILTLLENRSAYGLEIIQAIADLRQEAIAQGTLYPILKKLEDKDFVATKWGNSTVGARRKYYKITSAGKEALTEQRNYRQRLSEWSSNAAVSV